MSIAEKTAQKWFIGSYRHLQPYPRGNLYYAVRSHMGLSQSRISALFGVSLRAWQYRERYKRLYHCAEVAALQEVSGLDSRDFMELLKSVA